MTHSVLYMITISCQQKKDYIDKSMLDEIILYLKLHIDSLQIIHCVYENSGKYKQLHWHALVRVIGSFRWKRFNSFGNEDITRNTYRIHWKLSHNPASAIQYMKKDLKHQSQDDIFINNYYSINRFSESYLN